MGKGSSIHSTGDGYYVESVRRCKCSGLPDECTQEVTTYTVSMSQNAAGSRDYIVKLPKVVYNGSHFGTCTLGSSAAILPD